MDSYDSECWCPVCRWARLKQLGWWCVSWVVVPVCWVFAPVYSIIAGVRSFVSGFCEALNR